MSVLKWGSWRCKQHTVVSFAVFGDFQGTGGIRCKIEDTAFSWQPFCFNLDSFVLWAELDVTARGHRKGCDIAVFVWVPKKNRDSYWCKYRRPYGCQWQKRERISALSQLWAESPCWRRLDRERTYSPVAWLENEHERPCSREIVWRVRSDSNVYWLERSKSNLMAAEKLLYLRRWYVIRVAAFCTNFLVEEYVICFYSWLRILTDVEESWKILIENILSYLNFVIYKNIRSVRFHSSSSKSDGGWCTKGLFITV